MVSKIIQHKVILYPVFFFILNCNTSKESSVDSNEDEGQISKDDDKRSHVKKKIITIDDSSDDEEVIFETTLATATATASTSEVSKSKCCREDIYYGPPPPVASHAVALTYSEHGGAMVVQVDSVHHQ